MTDIDGEGAGNIDGTSEGFIEWDEVGISILPSARMQACFQTRMHIHTRTRTHLHEHKPSTAAHASMHKLTRLHVH